RARPAARAEPDSAHHRRDGAPRPQHGRPVRRSPRGDGRRPRPRHRIPGACPDRRPRARGVRAHGTDRAGSRDRLADGDPGRSLAGPAAHAQGRRRSGSGRGAAGHLTRPPTCRPLGRNDPSRREMRVTPIRRVIAATSAAGLLALAACSGGDQTDGSDASGGSGEDGEAGDFEPITLEHAFGSTEISEQPQDVVTLGWGSTEAALALGVEPVGIEQQTYGADGQGRLPWVAEALQEAGAEPTMLPPAVGEPPYEEIDSLSPDLILAPYSGIDEEQYELLSEIAPTVAYPEAPWTTPWRDVITLTGEALGLAGQADGLVEDLDGRIEQAVGHHPELEA